MSRDFVIRNGQAVPASAVPVLSQDAFHQWLLHEVETGGRLSSFFGSGGPDGSGPVRLLAVVAFDDKSWLSMAACDIEGGEYQSITPEWPQAHWFEREIAEQWGLFPTGHPWLKPVRWQEPYRGGTRRQPPCVGDFFRVEGAGAHEVAVGPIHAGIIEPGHFRFQCHGEQVFHLEIALGYQHRGIERALLGGPGKRTLHYMETAAGDTTIGHSTAYASAVEALSGLEVPPRAQALRAVALELERLANHTGDLGALAGDIGYLPTMSFCGRLRGDFLNMTALLCGNRFGRSFVAPGGVLFDVDSAGTSELLDRLEATFRDVSGAAKLLLETPSVLARFEHTGTVDRVTARALGLVGPAARASDLARDVRQNFPLGHFTKEKITPALWLSGDVLGRTQVRWQEIQESVRFIRRVLSDLPDGPVMVTGAPLEPDHLAVVMVEGWRGEICHVAATGSDGSFRAYKMVDPSFHNWMGLAMALRDQQISDFPLCNKSFNLSYCGHDL